jgi:tight adherence protein B
VTGAVVPVVLVLLVAGAVHGLAVGGAAGRRVGPAAARPVADGGAAGGSVGVTAPVRSRRRPGAAAADPTSVLGAAVTAVAAELRAGRAPGDAWRAVLGVTVLPGGVPLPGDVVAAVLRAADGRRLGARARGSGRPDAVLLRRVHAVLAASRLAVEVGAPLAPVLDACARTLAADADAETALRASLAGPRQTTTLLTALPLLAVLLGLLLGADPLGVLLGGGPGTLAGAVGLALTAVGRSWVGRMAARARVAGSPGSTGARGIRGTPGATRVPTPPGSAWSAAARAEPDAPIRPTARAAPTVPAARAVRPGRRLRA